MNIHDVPSGGINMSCTNLDGGALTGISRSYDVGRALGPRGGHTHLSATCVSESITADNIAARWECVQNPIYFVVINKYHDSSEPIRLDAASEKRRQSFSSFLFLTLKMFCF